MALSFFATKIPFSVYPNASLNIKKFCRCTYYLLSPMSDKAVSDTITGLFTTAVVGACRDLLSAMAVAGYAVYCQRKDATLPDLCLRGSAWVNQRLVPSS